MRHTLYAKVYDFHSRIVRDILCNTKKVMTISILNGKNISEIGWTYLYGRTTKSGEGVFYAQLDFTGEFLEPEKFQNGFKFIDRVKSRPPVEGQGYGPMNVPLYENEIYILKEGKFLCDRKSSTVSTLNALIDLTLGKSETERYNVAMQIFGYAVENIKYLKSHGAFVATLLVQIDEIAARANLSYEQQCKVLEFKYRILCGKKQKL